MDLQEASTTTDFSVRYLTHRNTPDPISKKAPSEILFGRTLRDSLPVFTDCQTPFHNENVLPFWRDGWDLKERALRTRTVKNIEALDKHSKDLPALKNGDKVFIQNQSGNHPKKWDRTGTVRERLDHHQYSVQNDESGKLTLRNRQFLRKYVPTARNVLLGVPPSVSSGRTEPILPHSEAKTSMADDVLQREPVSRVEDNKVCQPKGGEAQTSLPSIDAEPLRRSSRVRKQVKVYDADTGAYVEPGC